jgi:tRNA-splicing ligase RtcB
MNIKRLDEYRVLLPREGRMQTDAMVYVSEGLRIEDEALRQLQNAASIPGVRKVLATPDIHTGFGVPIGSVVAMPHEIIPSAVGYDVNCGMRLMTTPLMKEDLDVEILADSIRRDIPLGEGKKNLKLNKHDLKLILERGVKGMPEWAKRNPRLEKIWNDDEFEADWENIEENGSMAGRAAAVSNRAKDRGKNQIATLGGGNHFIEIQEVKSVSDENLASQFGIKKGQILVMIHSGSRGLGHQIGGDYMRLAAGTSKGKAPDRTLGFLNVDKKEGQDYIAAMHAAANYAFVNRQVMAMLVRKNFRYYFGDIPMPLIYDVPHNMAKLEKHGGEYLWVHRKGATRAFPKGRMRGTRYAHLGQPVIIPGSMGTASYLLLGEDSGAESLFSVNHGAGRTMSRRAAAGKVRRRDGKVIKPGRITDERFKETMKGIYLICEDRHTIKEEAPDAYKDIDEVIRVVVGAGLGKLVARMVPMAVLKG